MINVFGIDAFGRARISTTFLTGLALVALTTAVVSAGEASSSDHRKPARQAHEFTYEDINPRSATFGERIDLKGLYSGNGVVLNFIASWCPPCWQEIPHFQKVAEELEAPVACIAADEHGGTSDLLRLAEMHDVKLPILHVPVKDIALMERYYDHSMLPSTYLIDDEGGIRKVFQGLISEERLTDATRKYLEGAPDPEPGATRTEL